MASSSDGNSLDEVKQNQMDRLDEMQKLDGEVIGLNSAYIDILDRITQKLDLMATLADEIEIDARTHPQSMEGGLKMRFDLLAQSALMNRYMCSKALFQNAIGAIQSMNQFGCDYINMDNHVIGAPGEPSTSEGTENASQAHHSDESGDTLASDSDATVAARMDISDSQLSVMEEEVETTAGPSTSVPPQSLHEPSMPDFEKEEVVDAYIFGELEEIEREEAKGGFKFDPESILHVEIPKENSSSNPVSLTSAQSHRSVEWGRDFDEGRSTADSFQNIMSTESVGADKKKKKKKRKRSKSSEQRHRNKEAEKMENILNKHLKRSRGKDHKKSKEEIREKSPRASSPISKEIEVVTLSDDENDREVKKSKMDEREKEWMNRPSSSRVIPCPMTPTEDEDCENKHAMRDEMRETRNSEIEKTSSCTSNHVLSTMAHPPNPRVPSVPQPVPPPILPPSLGRGPGFVAAAMEESTITPSNWSSLNVEMSATADPDSSFSDMSMLIERSESRGDEEEEEDVDGLQEGERKDSRCKSIVTLKEQLEEDIKRNDNKCTPDRRSRSRSLTNYSPRRDISRSREKSRSRSREKSRSRSREKSRSRSREKSRSRSREKSRSRSRERREWRWGASRFRYGYRPRYQLYSRSPTRSRSRSHSRSRHSYSRERDESRHRWMSRSRSRSRSRGRSRSRSRSVSRGRSRSATSSSPSRRYKRSSVINEEEEKNDEKNTKKKNDQLAMDDEIIVRDGTIASSPSQEGIVRKTLPPPPPPPPPPSSSTHIPPPPPPPPPIISPSVSSSSRPHSGSSSPTIFVPLPPIILPPKPPTLKISIPSTLPTSKNRVKRVSSSSSLPFSSPSSLLPPSTNRQERRRGVQDNGDKSLILTRTCSDMSLEGNTVSEGSNGEERRRKGREVISDIPTPPLSNPSVMENTSSDGREVIPLPPPPSLPPLPPISPPARPLETTPFPESSAARISSTPIAPLFNPATMGGTRSSGSRAMNGPHPIYPLLGPHPHQFYSNMHPHNPYGSHNAWMTQDPQWQHYYYSNYSNYNPDMGMMGAYGSPMGLHHPVSQGPIPESHGSFMQAMRVIPSSLNQQPPPDWAQMARDHANQQLHVANAPPPPPLNQQGHMMGHLPPYGTPLAGRRSRKRGGGGKGRRW